MTVAYVIAALLLAVVFNALGSGWVIASIACAASAVVAFVDLLRDEYGDGEEDEP